MANKTIVAKLTKKASNGRGFQLEGQDGWFNASDEAKPYLAKLNTGTTINVEYYQDKIKKIAVKVFAAEAKEETTKPTCSVCGKELKDNKYPTCWDCKDKVKKEEDNTERKTSNYSGSSKYGSPEDVAGKEVGCAANCASVILQGAGLGADRTELMQLWRAYFNDILDHIRANK